MTPEGKTKLKVKALLKKYGTYYHMPVQNGMGAPTLDFICCHWGFYLAVETKDDGKPLTRRQELTTAAIEAADGKVLRIDSTNLDVLEEWLRVVKDSCS